MAVYWYNSLTDMLAYAERRRDDVLRDIAVQTDRGEEIPFGTEIELSRSLLDADSAVTESDGSEDCIIPAWNVTVTFDPPTLLEERMDELRERATQTFLDAAYLGNWYDAPRIEHHRGTRQAWVDEAAYVPRLWNHNPTWYANYVTSSPPQESPATEKAEELLLLCLNDHQKETYEEWGYFDVTGNAGGSYRIHNWYRSYNVFDLLSRAPYDACYGLAYYDAYCAMPMQGSKLFPFGDQLLAQKLMIETDEKGFLSKANSTCDVIDEIARFGCIPQEGRLK